MIFRKILALFSKNKAKVHQSPIIWTITKKQYLTFKESKLKV